MFRTLILTTAALTLAACSTVSTPAADLSDSTDRHTIYVSSDDFASVETRLRDGIEARPLTLFTVIDHGDGAQSVGMPIGASKLFVVGNPEVGTPFMVADPQMGLDLPLKILIHSTSNGTHLAYSHPGEAAMRHGIYQTVEPQIEKIHNVMDCLLSEAAGETVRVVNER